MKRIFFILLIVLLFLTATALASSSTIGIIGGADGPTAIFVSGGGFLSRLPAAVLRFFLSVFGGLICRSFA